MQRFFFLMCKVCLVGTQCYSVMWGLPQPPRGYTPTDPTDSSHLQLDSTELLLAPGSVGEEVRRKL